MKIPVTNNTEMPIYVGSSMVPPGETRHFDEQDVPHHLRPVADAAVTPDEQQADLIVDLAAGTVKAAIEQIPALSLADLERLGELEQTGQARVTLLSALSDELLKRTQDAHLAELLGGEIEVIIQALPALSDVGVARAAEIEQSGQARAAVIEALAAESIKRQG